MPELVYWHRCCNQPISLIYADHIVEKHSSMRHPTVGLFCADLVTVRTDQIRTITPIQAATTIETTAVLMVLRANKVM